MRTRTSVGTAGLLLALALSGCGGDDSGDAGAETDAGGDSAASSTDAPDGDDLLGEYLAGSGLSPDIMSGGESDCMNRELREAFPDGFPDGFREDQAATEEVIEAVDAAAEACDVVL
ncbi:hypothetical protein ACFP3Q_08040 [Nocardioides sp. GCM10027113]|uniref:hypothetical protein n=1 Tax=unclassified Nocardioides TaxID=2615069 RepID=UPI00360BF056